MKISDRSSSRRSSSSRRRIWARTETSSALTASSQTISFGRVINARAMATRWHCPPENWWG